MRRKKAEGDEAMKPWRKRLQSLCKAVSYVRYHDDGECGQRAEIPKSGYSEGMNFMSVNKLSLLDHIQAEVELPSTMFRAWPVQAELGEVEQK